MTTTPTLAERLEEIRFRAHDGSRPMSSHDVDWLCDFIERLGDEKVVEAAARAYVDEPPKQDDFDELDESVRNSIRAGLRAALTAALKVAAAMEEE